MLLLSEAGTGRGGHRMRRTLHEEDDRRGRSWTRVALYEAIVAGASVCPCSGTRYLSLCLRLLGCDYNRLPYLKRLAET